MHRFTRTLLALGIVSIAAPARAQEPDTIQAADQPTFAGSYWTFGGLYHSASQEYDLMVFLGQTWPFGGMGGWTMRAGLGAGVSFYNFNDTGALTGVQVGLERMLTGDRLQLRDGQPLELYALLGGAAYAGFNQVESQGSTALVPGVSAGLGLRWRGSKADEPMLTLELYREERFAGFDPRLYVRFDYMQPRGKPPATPPPPGRP